MQKNAEFDATISAVFRLELKLKREMKLDLKKLGLFGAIVVSGLFLNSCLNDDLENPYPEDAGWIAFINASPDSEMLKFYSNGNNINSPGIGYSQFINYVAFEAGTHNLTVNSGSGENLDTLSLDVEYNKWYSIYAVNSMDNLELVAYSDSFITPSEGKASIKFIQLSPDAPQLKVAIEDANDNLGTFLFKQASPFMEINESFHKNLYLIDAVTNDTIFTKQVDFTNGRTYAVFSKGFYETDNTSQDLDVQIIPY